MKRRIIGAGFSGLTLAWYMTQLGLEVEIFEELSEPGGLIHTYRRNSLRETAANAMIASGDVMELFEELQVPWTQTLKEARRRFIYRNGLKRWPLGFFETFQLLLKIFKNFIFTNKKNPLPGETIAQWCERVLTNESKNYLVAPALAGVYAGDIERLQAEIILGPLFSAPKNKSQVKGSVSPLGGMGALIEALRQNLLRKGVAIHYNHKIERYEDDMILAVPANRAAEILKDQFSTLAQALSKIEMLNVCSVHLEFVRPERKIHGFGVLFPATEKFHSLGALSNLFIFPERGPQYSENWIIGGALNPGVGTMSSDEIIHVVLEDRKKMLKSGQSPDSVSVVNWRPAFPHYDHNLSQFLNIYRDYPQVLLTGNYLGMLGLSKILSSNKNLAQQINRMK